MKKWQFQSETFRNAVCGNQARCRIGREKGKRAVDMKLGKSMGLQWTRTIGLVVEVWAFGFHWDL